MVLVQSVELCRTHLIQLLTSVNFSHTLDIVLRFQLFVLNFVLYYLIVIHIRKSCLSRCHSTQQTQSSRLDSLIKFLMQQIVKVIGGCLVL